MSITIDSDAPRSYSQKQEPCLCAQMAESFSDFFNGQDTPEMRADLKANANPNCPTCKGTGIEYAEVDDAPFMNLSNDNAAIFFAILGVQGSSHGEMSLPEARRALMRASSRDLSKYERPEKKLHGKPQEVEPGVVDMRPVKYWEMGLDQKKLQAYIQRFAQFLHEVSQRGAKKIRWY